MGNRRSNAIQVLNNGDGEIRIQWEGTQSNETFVLITAEQAEQVCKWIMETAAEIETENKDKDG